MGDVIRELRSGAELGVVKDVKVQDHRKQAPDAQGNWHMSVVPGRKTVILTVEGDLPAYNHQFRVGQADVKVGSKITISSNRYNFEGVFIKVEAGTEAMPQAAGARLRAGAPAHRDLR